MCKQESSHMTHTLTLHYTNRLRAHTHTLKCAHDTHRWVKECMMGHIETGTHDIQRNTRRASQPQAEGKGVMGVRGQRLRADGRLQTTCTNGLAVRRALSMSSRTLSDQMEKNEETSSRGDVRLARR